MPEYAGTISGTGTIVGTGQLAGDTATIMESDKFAVILNINSTNQTYTGTIDQVTTTSGTYSEGGGASTPFGPTTEDSGTQPLPGGPEAQPETITYNTSGTINSIPYTLSITETLQLAANQSSISVSGTETVTADGQTTNVPFSGTLNAVPPIVTATTFITAIKQPTAAASFFMVSNPTGDNITEYQFEDSGGGSGYFTVNGTVQPDGIAFQVLAGNLGSVQYVGGSSVGTDKLTVEAYDASIDEWVPASLNAITELPTLTANSFPVALNQSIAAASLFTVSNPTGDNITQYLFEDNGGGSGHFTENGTVKPDGTAFTVLAGNLSSVQYVGGSSAGTDTLVIDAYDATAAEWLPSVSISAVTTALLLNIQNDYLAITRTALPLDQATTIVNEIIADTTTETAYVNGLLQQVADTTIPVVAVEASMYGAVGSSAVITNLVTNFLPGQLAYASQVGLDPVVFACLETALVFAFSNETGATTFANNYGPLNTAMPATAAGDAAFAAAATNAIFGSAQTANTAPAILGYINFLEGFFTANGIVGVQNPTPDQIVIAARAGAWGEGVAIALENNLGAIPGQTTNFLEDAAQGTAVYGAPLLTQPTPAAFQGAATASVATTASDVQVTGVSAHVDHIAL